MIVARSARIFTNLFQFKTTFIFYTCTVHVTRSEKTVHLLKKLKIELPVSACRVALELQFVLLFVRGKSGPSVSYSRKCSLTSEHPKMLN